MPIDAITVSVDSRIMAVRIDRPAKRNAIDLDMYRRMADALAEADADPGVRVILFEGSAGNFTSGNDLSDFRDPTALDADSPVFHFIEALVSARKPLVAAVEGLAIGIGVTMLLHFDLVYAGEGSRFQLPFVGLGLCPEAGSSQLLPLAAGYRLAAELFLLGEPFDAAAAQRAGIVNEVVPTGQAGQVARQKAQKVAAQPAAAVRLAKELLRRGERQSLGATIRLEAEHFREGLRSPEAAEALAAFAGRRSPDFSRFP
ncbi:MAG: enoyl-CoA hydratase-related protein [Rectinemataceae bacterium]